MTRESTAHPGAIRAGESLSRTTRHGRRARLLGLRTAGGLVAGQLRHAAVDVALDPPDIASRPASTFRFGLGERVLKLPIGLREAAGIDRRAGLDGGRIALELAGGLVARGL